MLRHPVLKKLWRARQAEARLLAWRERGRAAPTGGPTRGAAAQRRRRRLRPEALERGPIVLCLDTSGSMRGAPENIAKAVAIAALRVRPRAAAAAGCSPSAARANCVETRPRTPGARACSRCWT